LKAALDKYAESSPVREGLHDADLAALAHADSGVREAQQTLLAVRAAGQLAARRQPYPWFSLPARVILRKKEKDCR
jgi:hypothetical protein